MKANFKILAVEPLEGCESQFLKVLKMDCIYLLYNNYQITKRQVRFEEDELLPEDFFELKNGRRINVSAIVGKNGSGKSSIVELLYATIYNVAFVSGILSENVDKSEKVKFEEGVFASIYYQKGEDFLCLQCRGTEISILRQVGANGQFQIYQDDQMLRTLGLSELFYTIAINYSHYALNSIHSSPWLKHLFHKNDGYQTPIVINPFRDEGKIAINNEEHLTLSRIATNLLTIRDNEQGVYNELIPGKKASHIRFRLNITKTKMDDLPQGIRNGLEVNRDKIIEIVYREFDIRVDQNLSSKQEKLLAAANSYLCKKLYQISDRYKPYSSRSYRFVVPDLLDDVRIDKEGFKFYLGRLENLVLKMRQNPSHITSKFRQAINFIKNISFYSTRVNRLLSIDDLSRELNRIAKKDEPLITVIPPSFFTIDIKFGSQGYLKTLSSGEKQLIYSSASWIYHLMNLDSVREDSKAGYNRYTNINIVFDEIELYYHPDLQRRFVQDFINNVSRISLSEDIDINCIFITHSPFILSDIPNQNILFLNDEGLPDEKAMATRTFGANIHDLLAESFFLNNGLIGAFAKHKIQLIIDYLSDDNELPKSKEILHRTLLKQISLIGEPFLRDRLLDLYYLKFDKQKRIAELTEEINRLRET